MIKFSTQDGETKLKINISMRELIDLIIEAEQESLKMGYVFNTRCFINYVIAHYQGNTGTYTFNLDPSLIKL